MVSTLSKYKNIFGEQNQKGQFYSVEARNNSNSDGSSVDVSPDFVAINWLTKGGGAIGIFETNNFMRVKSNFPLIRGHSAAVTDLKFSPFVNNLLASASEDGTVKIWTIPENGLKEDISGETQLFNGHSKKVSLLAFHPSVRDVIASVGSAQDLFVWNITNSEVLSKINLNEQAYNIDWNYLGSLAALMCKNKKAYVYDVRSNSEVLSTDGHDTAKVQKVNFADDNYMFSTGFSSKGYREIKFYDVRNFKSPVQSQKIDTLSGMLSNYYDRDTGVAYLTGKGEGIVTYLEIKDGLIKPGSTYSSNEQAISYAFFPKRTMDYNSCELVRCAKLTKDTCCYISFKYPRRNQGYSEEFYPDCVVGEPAMSTEEWMSGKNTELKRASITTIENKFKSEVIQFNKKVVEEKKSFNLDDVLRENENLKRENEELKKEIERLNSKLQSNNL